MAKGRVRPLGIRNRRGQRPRGVVACFTTRECLVALERKRSAGLLTLRVTLTNQRGETILEGQHKYLVAYRP